MRMRHVHTKVCHEKLVYHFSGESSGQRKKSQQHLGSNHNQRAFVGMYIGAWLTAEGIKINPKNLKAVTHHVKAMADHKRITLSDVDELLHQWADSNYNLGKTKSGSKKTNNTNRQTHN